MSATVFNNGTIVELAEAVDVFNRPSAEYTRLLLENTPDFPVLDNGASTSWPTLGVVQ